jgi:hypothetical protein
MEDVWTLERSNRLPERIRYIVYNLPDIIGVIKSRSMRWAGHVAQNML